ncbi:MAG TPA: MscL family protein [Candidatus Saccharimonadales bacterium]|nr:MscL family protein [Candidatus Saccharimonadales bacterium]
MTSDTTKKDEAESHEALATKSQAQLKREMRARMRHLDTGASTDFMNELFSRQVNGFVDFLREQSVVGVAVGLVLGTQIKTVVDQFVSSFLNPTLGLILPGVGGLASQDFRLHANGKTVVFTWGAFVSTLISFTVIAMLVYYTFRALRLDKLKKKA